MLPLFYFLKTLVLVNAAGHRLTSVLFAGNNCVTSGAGPRHNRTGPHRWVRSNGGRLARLLRLLNPANRPQKSWQY